MYGAADDDDDICVSGTCQLSWSVYLLGTAVTLLLLCFALSFCSARETSTHPSFHMPPYSDGIASVT